MADTPQDQNVPSSPDIDAGTFPSPSSVLPPASNMPMVQPTAPVAPVAGQPPTGQPTGQPTTPQVSPAAKAQQLHSTIFQNILGTLAGGSQRPVMGQNGQPQTDANGQVVMAPSSRKALGASILAGALSSMVAGMAAPTKYNEVAPGRFKQDVGASVAAGAQAGQQFTQAGAQAKAQGQADDTRLRAYATADHNLKFHAMSMANDKADRENQQDVVDTWNSTRDAMDAEASGGKVQDAQGNDIDLYSYQNITGTKAMELVNKGNANITKDQLIPTQVIDVPNADGNGTHPETLFSVYNPNALVAINDKLREDNPNLEHVADGTKIPVRVLAQGALNRSNQVLASAGVDNWTKGYNDANKDTPITKNFNLKAAAAKDPVIQKLYPLMSKYHMDSVDAFFADLKKDPAYAKDQTMQTAAAKLQDAMGITSSGLEKVVAQKDQAIASAKKGVDGQPAPKEQVTSFHNDIGMAYPNLSTAQKDILTKSLGENPSNADYAKMQKQAEEEDASNTRLLAEKMKTDPADPYVVDAIGTGHIDPGRVAYLIAKTPALYNAIIEKYPDYDNSKTQSYATMFKDYVDGPTSKQLMGGAVAFEHLKEAQELNTPMSMIPGTSAYTAYKNKVDTLAGELTAFYGHSTDIEIAALKSTLQSPLEYQRTAAIKTQAHSMGDRMDEYEQKWNQGKPSKYYEAAMPHLSDKAKAARQALDPSYTFEPMGKEAAQNAPAAPTRPAPPVGFNPIPVQSPAQQ
jgi:hypothetical protein